MNLFEIFGKRHSFVACEHGQECFVKCLIDNFADIKLCTEYREIPLFVECENGL